MGHQGADAGRKDDWLRLAAQWESLAMEANPSGHLPWKVEAA